MTAELRCRLCNSLLTQTFADLGSTPLANSYLRADDLDREERRYPLHARVCARCFLVQVPEMASPEELFGDYAYYSSFSTSWLEHSRRFAAAAIARFGLTPDSMVVEVASNDGYLLRYFQQGGVPVLGIEPARNIAKDAVAAGIPTECEFFGAAYARDLAERIRRPDLLIGNNVLAHVPDLNDFVEGLATLLRPGGALVMEFPHLLNLITEVQFDTIYHEHFSYLSLLAVENAFSTHGLSVYDVERISTHGGSLRVFAEHSEGGTRGCSEEVERLRRDEREAELDKMSTYADFAVAVENAKDQLRSFLNDARAAGHTVAAYGAAAKGNTLLNTIGAGTDLVQYVVDRSPHKQQLYLPGSRIPIFAPEHILQTKPDFVLILPWNLKDEIVSQIAEIRSWGGRFVTAIPETRVLP